MFPEQAAGAYVDVHGDCPAFADDSGENGTSPLRPERERARGYQCPGEAYTISRSVHLGRLAAYYPACRQCRHREDTGTVSPQRVKRLAALRNATPSRATFFEEGISGVYHNGIGPPEGRRLAAAMALWLRRQQNPGCEPPTVVMAGDGRDLTPELVAAVGEGLCWAGCHVFDIGPASAGCLAFAVGHLDAAGGILVGNPLGGVHTAGLKLWARQAKPLSIGSPTDPVRRLYDGHLDRPTRSAGYLRRWQAEGLYLAGLEPYYHALRPLRFLVDSSSVPFVGYVEKLIRAVGCQMIRRGAAGSCLAEQIRQDRAHFALLVEDDAERCLLVDEQARPVHPERFLVLVAASLAQVDQAHCGSVVLLETESSERTIQALRSLGYEVATSSACRAEMHQAMHRHGAVLGGGPSGRLWHRRDNLIVADALVSLTLLLRLLSQSDRPVSEVLDALGKDG